MLLRPASCLQPNIVQRGSTGGNTLEIYYELPHALELFPA